MNAIKIEIRNVYGIEKAYPACDQARRFADLIGTKTFTRPKLNSLLAIGVDVELVAFGQVVRTFRAGEINQLPAVA